MRRAFFAEALSGGFLGAGLAGAGLGLEALAEGRGRDVVAAIGLRYHPDFRGNRTGRRLIGKAASVESGTASKGCTLKFLL